MTDITVIKDELGRKISIKKPATLERINFFRIIGAEDCGNPMVLAELSNALWVQSIDERPMPKKQMIDIELIITELEKGNADELISKHKIELFKKKQETDKEENKKGETEILKK